MTAFVGAALTRDGAVLLGWRSARRRFFPSCWDVIGGHVEPGESLEQALDREMREEIAVAPRAFRMLATLALEEDGAPATLTLFVVDAWDGEPVLANDEHERLGWFSLEDACALEGLASALYRPAFAALAASLGGPKPVPDPNFLDVGGPRA